MRAFIKKISNIRKGQKGLSLIELLVAIAISGLIVAGITMTIFQIYRGHAQTSGEMMVIRQVQQTGYHMSRDIQMARDVLDTHALVDINPDTTEIVNVTWYWFKYDPDSPDRDGEGNKVIYTLEDDRLYRNYYFADEDLATGEVNEEDYELKSRTFIAEYINNIEIVPENGVYKITVTASVDGIAGEQTETRTYEAKTRPNVF